MIEEASKKFKVNIEFAKEWVDKLEYEFEFNEEAEQAAVFYYVSKYFIQEWGPNRILSWTYISGTSFDERRIEYIETFINPLVEYLHDKIDKSSSILYLLEKYKKRVEWFKKIELYERYKSITKGYEQYLEDDLRLFLFDQGIDYPFSTPKSSSGRADIVGLIDTEDPLIVEIKIYDTEKGYGKERIISGFSQVIKYSNDYNKDSGFLVIFNFDNKELRFNLNLPQPKFPPSLIINNKNYYFIIVNLFPHSSASKIGKTEFIEINESDLTKGM